MKYGYHYIEAPFCYLLPISDTHIGDNGFEGKGETLLKENINWVKEEPNACVFLNGDILNCATRSSASSPLSQRSNLKEQIERAVELFSPIKDKIVGCVSDDTYCLTKQGWALLKDCSIGDEVLSFNDKKNCFEYESIDKVFEYDYSGKVYNLKNSNLDFQVTPEHRIIYKPEWEKVKRKFKHKTTTSQYRVKKAKDFFSSYISKYNIPIGSNYYSDKGKLSNDDLSLLGWIISEGTMPCGRGDIQIYQSRKNQKKIDMILSLLNNLNIQYKIYNYKGKGYGKHYGFQRDWVSIWISTKQSKKYIDILNSQKRIPRKILIDYSSENLEHIFQSLVLGDGHMCITKNSGVFYTSDKLLAEEFLELALKTNRRAQISYRKRYNKFDEYSVNFSKTSFNNPNKRSVNASNYNGKVYSLSLKNTFYLAMRNGKPFITGNSIDGNHENRLVDFVGYSPTTSLCHLLDIPYYGYSAVIEFKVGVGALKGRGNATSYVGYFHHTIGGGSSPGGKMNRVDKLRTIVCNADFYVGSHNHQLGVIPVTTRCVDIRRKKVHQMRQLLIDSGSYLSWDDTYSEANMFPPVKLGSVRIRMAGCHNGKDIHASI